VDAQIAQQSGLARPGFWLGGIVLRLRPGGDAFIWRVVYRPVKELDRWHAPRAPKVILNYRLPVRSDDELGYLAAGFNKMTAEVAGVQAKIEEQVRRKTAELERIHKHAAQLGKDGLHRQAGRHRGA
jgi:hypothetical protein